MKITFVLPFAGLSGGVRVVSIYAAELAARGHDIKVVSQPLDRPGLRSRLRAFLRRTPLSRPVPSPFLAGLGERHRILDRPRPVTGTDLEDADFVIATWWETAEWIARLPDSKGQKIYLLQDYEMFPYTPHDRVAATYHAGLRMLAVSSYIRKTIAENHGVEDIDLLLNGIDVQQFQAPARERNSSMTVGFLFQLSERKNMPLAIEIIERAKARIPDLDVIAFGSTPPSDEHPLPDYVKLAIAPPQDDIPALYALCDAWILPSEKEGFGLPLLEAMACRTPVLATSFGASEDIVVDGRNGWILPPDADAFVDKLDLLRRMPGAEWKRMSEQARETATSWEWKTRVDQFEHYLARWRS